MRVQPSAQTYVGNMMSMLALVAIIDCAVVYAQPDATVQPTCGKYMGQSWHIDTNHLLWWQGKPYVRYGFTGNGGVDRLMNMSFTQFNAYPSEALWVFSKDPVKNQQAVREVNEFTDLLQEKRATYYAGLNLLWPWGGSAKIADAGLGHLKGMSGLKTLRLQGTQVTDAGIKQLKQSLPRLTINQIWRGQ